VWRLGAVVDRERTVAVADVELVDGRARAAAEVLAVQRGTESEYVRGDRHPFGRIGVQQVRVGPGVHGG
jgi:hypothetical protein